MTTANEVIRATIAESIDYLQKWHPAAMRLQAEPIHQMRVGTRKLRAILVVYQDLIDRESAAQLEIELRWLAHLLGAVRDLDVLRERLRTAAKSSDGQIISIVSIDRVLAKRHKEAQIAMKAGLTSDRYHALLEQLTIGRSAPSTTIEAGELAMEAFPTMIRKAWKKLERKANKLEENANATKFHAVRKMGKRLRYSVESLLPYMEDKDRGIAERFVKKLKKLQDTLGELQDSVVATRTIELVLETNSRIPSAQQISAKNLIKHQQKCEKRARKKFQKVWDRTSAKDLHWWTYQGR